MNRDCDHVELPKLKQYFCEDWNPYTDTRHKRNNVGQCVWLRWTPQPQVACDLFVANVHLFWDPLHEDVKLLQTLQAVHEIDEFIQRCEGGGVWNDHVSVLLTGDFNSSPGTLIYKLLTDGRVKWYSHEQLVDIDTLNRTVNNYTTTLATPIFERHVTVGIPFHFQSAIGSVLGKEMDWSNRTEKFTDTIDYIFYYSTQLRPIQVLPCPELLQKYESFLPNENFPSDHIPLGCRLEWIENKHKDVPMDDK